MCARVCVDVLCAACVWCMCGWPLICSAVCLFTLMRIHVCVHALSVLHNECVCVVLRVRLCCCVGVVV